MVQFRFVCHQLSNAKQGVTGSIDLKYSPVDPGQPSKYDTMSKLWFGICESARFLHLQEEKAKKLDVHMQSQIKIQFEKHKIQA